MFPICPSLRVMSKGLAYRGLTGVMYAAVVASYAVAIEWLKGLA